ncbi:MAG: DUF2797 domain-containing protein [Bacteroidales bacterium]|jgi:hypothetical protein|nr:DUF2797 domain-containing protein [Bacteroidales bacterium]
MRTTGSNPVSYFLTVGDIEISMNDLIGKQINIKYKNQINCINCNSITNKSFHQGYCYSCFVSLPQADEGVLHPEKDMSHLGISRDMEWAKKHSLIDHYVYLAITGNIKVGVTRYTQIPYRWIDQGAISAIKLAKTPYRNLAGQIEVELSKYISDKTSWTKMLQTQTSDIDLVSLKKQISVQIPDEYKKYITFDNTITNIHYPYNYNIQKFRSLNLDTNNTIEGKLSGIKAQYLIFDSGDVINIRKHNGYFIDLEIFE